MAAIPTAAPALAILAAAALADARAADAGDGPEPWRDAAALQGAIEERIAGRSSIARLSTYGTSRAGRELWCVELGPVGHPRRERLPALLVVAGLDGQHLVGTELVLDHLSRLVTGHGSDPDVTRLLDRHMVYLIPRANPDGAEAYFRPPGGARREVRGNLRPVDEDRDGALDEDGPEDLDHDGIITQMRWRDPAGTLIADPDEPRILRPADPLKGERGLFKAGVEAIDKDGDGEFGEDGAGDVVPGRNFPQRWQEFDPAAGRVPMEEPEALALGQFLIDRPAIALVVVYGLHDNVAVDAKADSAGETPQGPGAGGSAGVPPSGGRGGGGFRGPRTMPSGIVRDDQPLFAELATRYRATAGVTSRPLLEADDGAFFAFAYFQFGVPALAMHVWSPPLDVKKPAAEGAAPEAAKDDAAPGEGAAPESGARDDAEPPEPAGGRRGRRSGAGGRGSSGRDGPGGGDAAAPGAGRTDPDEPKLLLWNDFAMGGAAFAPWTKVRHPTLGEVEVGGWKPYLRANPPAALLPELAKKHGDFLLQLGGLFAELRVGDVKVENLGGGIFRVSAAVVNEGWLPSVCSMGERSRRPRPTRLDLDPGAAKLLQGDRRHTWTMIEGSGGRREVKWLLQAEPGASIRLLLWSEKGGDDERAVGLE